MSREPDESPDEDGEPDDQPAGRKTAPDPADAESTEGAAGDDSEKTIHRLDGNPDDSASDDEEAEAPGGEVGEEKVTGEEDAEEAPDEAVEEGETPDVEGAKGNGGDGEEDEGEEPEGEESVDGNGEGESNESDGSDETNDEEEGREEEADEEESGDESGEDEEDEDVAGESEEAEDREEDETDVPDESEDEGSEEAEDREEDETDVPDESEDEGPDEPEDEAESETTTTPIERKTGPSEDEEQPLTEHIEEMVKRVAIVLVIAGLVSLIAFPYGEEFINFLWYSVLPSDISKPHVYHPLELIVTQLKAASLLGVVLALPVFVYQTYAFMRPGLYPHERRYYLAAVPTSLVLAFVGLLFGYFLILPAVMSYFMQYSRDVVDIAFALGETFSLMLVLLGFLAVVFQIPLFIMLAIMMGLTTRTWLEDRRLIMWGVFLGIAFLFSPDPTGMAPFIVALTMVGLYEGTLLLLRWTGRGDG